MTSQIKIKDDEYFVREFGWTKSQFEIIQNTFFKGMDTDQIKIFAHVCKHTGLDPFLKQIYPVVRQGKMCIQTAIDGYRLIAERTGNYSPGRESTFVYKGDGSILSATSYVKKRTSDGTWHEIGATAYFDEYNPSVGPFWKKMPHVMISKCAEALALRKAFPAELSAIRTDDEMNQADSIEVFPQKEVVKSEEPQENLMEADQISTISSMLTQCSNQYIKEFYMNIKKHWDCDEISDIPQNKYHALVSKIQLHIDSRAEEVINE